ncbi:hypothetical protein HKD37_15G043935 [Glycine soja]
MYDSIMSEEIHMNEQNEDEAGVNEEHDDCSNAFNTSQVFATQDDVLQWARFVAYEIGFVAVIMRSNTNIGMRVRTSFVLIGCEKKCGCPFELHRKCRCPFKLRRKPMVGGQGWMVKLMCGRHNHEMTKSLVGHSYAGRLTKDEKTIIADMTKSMVKPRNILLTLKEQIANSCTTIKQIYNARSAYRSSIRDIDIEIQHLMKLLERDVVHDIFWCHPDAMVLCNARNLVFLIDNTYKTNKYRLSLLDFVGVTPTRMTFYASIAYLEGERQNNVRPNIIFMNVVKIVFHECTNLCRFHIDKNVKAKCKSLIGQKNTWDYVMDVGGSLVDCPSEHQFDDFLKKFEIVMHLGNTKTNRVESAHWTLKRLLHNSLRDLCSVWDVINNMITLQHIEIVILRQSSDQLHILVECNSIEI